MVLSATTGEFWNAKRQQTVQKNSKGTKSFTLTKPVAKKSLQFFFSSKEFIFALTSRHWWVTGPHIFRWDFPNDRQGKITCWTNLSQFSVLWLYSCFHPVCERLELFNVRVFHWPAVAPMMYCSQGLIVHLMVWQEVTLVIFITFMKLKLYFILNIDVSEGKFFKTFKIRLINLRKFGVEACCFQRDQQVAKWSSFSFIYIWRFCLDLPELCTWVQPDLLIDEYCSPFRVPRSIQPFINKELQVYFKQLYRSTFCANCSHS